MNTEGNDLSAKIILKEKNMNRYEKITIRSIIYLYFVTSLFNH